MKDALILQILANLSLQRLQVRKDVAVGDNHAARLGSGSGGEDNLHDVIARHTRTNHRFVRQLGELLAKRFQFKVSHARKRVVYRADTQLRIHLLRYSRCKIRSRNFVDGNDDGSTQQAAEECDDPLRAILAPAEHLIALANPARIELSRKTVRVLQHLAVCPALHAIAATEDA